MKIQTNFPDHILENLTNVTVGWDSEFHFVNHVQIPLSYQLYFPATDHEVFIHAEDQKLEFQQIIQVITGFYPNVTEIRLVGHFNYAELSSLADGRSVVQGDEFFISSKTFGGKTQVGDIVVHLYDTQHYFQTSLEAIGEWIGIEKVKIVPYKKSEMNKLYQEDFQLFYRYAMTDSKITAIAYERIYALVHTHLGLDVLPKTAGAVGAKIISGRLSKDKDRAYKLGYNTEYKRIYSRINTDQSQTEVDGQHRKGKKIIKKYKKIQTRKGIESRYLDVYCGGKNELYVRGLIADTVIYDYDLVSAYTTAQASIGEYDLDIKSDDHLSIFIDPEECYQYLRDNPFDFGWVMLTQVKHKPDTKFPVIHEKIDGNIIFTLTGSHCYLTSLEFLAAYPTFESISGFEAVINKRISDNSIISEFQQQIRELRQACKKDGDTFADKVFKQIGNSTYGKLHQGYGEKSTIDLKQSGDSKKRSKKVPKSSISNPLLSSYVTGFTRAIAFETLNELHRIGLQPLYWTTDGFATVGEVPDYIVRGDFGIFTKAVSKLMREKCGTDLLYELKHRGRGWIGVKTRGYCMLEKMEDHALLFSFANLQTKYLDDKTDFILKEFTSLTRFKETVYPEFTITPISDWLDGKEYGNIEDTKCYNWDFDLKRVPDQDSMQMKNECLCFDTRPHHHLESFVTMRNYYDAFKKKKNQCRNKIVTEEHYQEFIEYCDDRDSMEEGERYLTAKRHLRWLANFMKHRSSKGIGYKKIAKLLQESPNTVKTRWIPSRMPISKPKTLLKYIVKAFELNAGVVVNGSEGMQFSYIGINNELCTPNNDVENFTESHLEKSEVGIVTKGMQFSYIGINNELCTPSTPDLLTTLYSQWNLNHYYSLEMFEYLLEFVFYLDSKIYRKSEVNNQKNEEKKQKYVE